MALHQPRPTATRQDVLRCAGEIFETTGYAGSTLAQIAERAGASVAEILAQFGGKADLLAQLLADRLQDLHEDLDAVAQAAPGGAAQRLGAIMTAHHRLETRRAQMLMTYLGGANPASLVAPTGPDQGLRRLIRPALDQGRRQGEIAPTIDLNALADRLVALYGWTFRRTPQSEVEMVALVEHLNRQIAQMLDPDVTA